VGLNPFRSHARHASDVALVFGALVIVIALVLWAVFG
jgi:hypothetical protein